MGFGALTAGVLAVGLLGVVIGASGAVVGRQLVQANMIERDGSRLIATGDQNYALTSPKLMGVKSWRAVSVNGDAVLAITSAGQRLATNKWALVPSDLQLIERLRDELVLGRPSRPRVSSFSSSSTSVFTSSSVSSSSTSGSARGLNQAPGELSFNSRDSNNYSVARPNLPFNWAQVFINDDLVTLVHTDGQVLMLPLDALEPTQREAVVQIQTESARMQRLQAHQMASILQNSLHMISGLFGNIMATPNDYQQPMGLVGIGRVSSTGRLAKSPTSTSISTGVEVGNPTPGWPFANTFDDIGTYRDVSALGEGSLLPYLT